MRFAFGDSGSFLDAVKDGLLGAAFNNDFGGGVVGRTGAWDPTKGVVGTAFNNDFGGGVVGRIGAWDPRKGVVGTDSAATNFIKEGGVAGLTTGHNPLTGIVGDRNPFGDFGGGLGGVVGGLVGKGGESKGVSGLGGFRPAGFIGSLFGA